MLCLREWDMIDTTGLYVVLSGEMCLHFLHLKVARLRSYMGNNWAPSNMFPPIINLVIITRFYRILSVFCLVTTWQIWRPAHVSCSLVFSPSQCAL